MEEKKIKTLFVVMPFHNIWSPNVGTSVLQGVLRNKGYTCDIYYANIEFAKLTGLDFAEVTHNSFLLSNDLLFADLLDNKTHELTELTGGNENLQRKVLFQKVLESTNAFINSAASKIVEGKYDLVGFSLIFQSVPSLVLAKKVKELSPKTKIIIGGSNCAGEMGLAFHKNYPWVDYVCIGDGENLIVELIEYLDGKERFIEKIEGLVYRESGSTIKNGRSAQAITNLDELPYPDYSDWVKQLELNGFDKNSERCILPLETSRGCWYAEIQQCVFCGLNGGNLNARIKSSGRAIKEIQSLSEKYSISNFLSTDLVFPNQYFDTFLLELSQSNLDVNLIYEVKANLSRQQLEKFVKASIKTLQPGLETLSSAVLRKMRKGTKAYHNIRILKWAFEMGVSIIWNIIYGIPGEKQEDYEEMAKLIPKLIHLQPPLFGVFPIVLQRFSPLYNEIQETGQWDIKPLKEYYKIYNLQEDDLKKLAYYFVMPEETNFEYVEPLKNKLSEWFNYIGKSVFFLLNMEDKLYLYDTRPLAKEEIRILEDLEMKVYEACDKGVNIQVLTEKLDVEEEKLKPILDKFVKNALVLFIDNKYLSLAVSMNEYIQEELEAEINLTICASIYRTLMKKKCDRLKKVGERNLEHLKE